MNSTLSPAQQQAYSTLLKAIPAGNVFVIQGEAGTGKSTLLHHFHNTMGGGFLTMNEFIHALRDKHPLSLEETLERMLAAAINSHEIIYFDDLHLLWNVTCMTGEMGYPRPGFLNAPLSTLCAATVEARKKLVITLEGECPAVLQRRATIASIPTFGVEDYAFFMRSFLGDAAEFVDAGTTYAYATGLNAQQIRVACHRMRSEGQINTLRMIELIKETLLFNTRPMEPAQHAQLGELIGCETLVDSLETHLLMPLEHPELAYEQKLRPVSGILLYGPAGTRKTTIGRALAARLKNKYLMVESVTMRSPEQFETSWRTTLARARQVAPCLIALDDADLLMRTSFGFDCLRGLASWMGGPMPPAERGISLLVMAENLQGLPLELLHSGRLELLLQTRLPDISAREAMWQRQAVAMSTSDLDNGRLANESDGFSGADIRRISETVRRMMAQETLRGVGSGQVMDRLLNEIHELRSQNEQTGLSRAVVTSREQPRLDARALGLENMHGIS